MSQTFDGWLEHELDRGFAALSAYPVPSESRYRAAQRGPRGLAAGRRRFLMPLLATALMAGGGTAAAATGTNPVVLGQQISEGVVTCKDQLGSGQQGIGECISEVVAAHRAAVEDAPTIRGRVLPAAVGQTRDVEPASRAQPAASRDEKGRSDNHGSDVSDAARSTPPGPEHGEAVSAAARSNRPDRGPDGLRVDDDQRGNRPGNSGKDDEAKGRPEEPPGQGRGQGASNRNRGNSAERDRAIAAPTKTPTTDVRPGNSGDAPGRGRGQNR